MTAEVDDAGSGIGVLRSTVSAQHVTRRSTAMSVRELTFPSPAAPVLAVAIAGEGRRVEEGLTGVLQSLISWRATR